MESQSSTMPRCPVPLQPTYHGYLSSTLDALVLIEACLQGLLSHVPRRPQDRERPELIRSGNIFIYEENASGIKRWTDGVNWSPSRILGNFLIYRELDKPFEPGQKKRALKGKQRKGPANGVTKRSSQSPPARTGIPTASRVLDKDLERALVGSLVDSYPFKEEGGLIKKTISVPYRGVLHHVVSYYTTEDVVENRLQLPSEMPLASECIPRPELVTRQNFRAPLEPNTALMAFNTQPQMAGYQHGPESQVHLQGMPGGMQAYRQPMQMPNIPQTMAFPADADFSWGAQMPYVNTGFQQHPQQQLANLQYGHGNHQEEILPFDDERVPSNPNLMYHVPSST